jgi:hypothetical protein
MIMGRPAVIPHAEKIGIDTVWPDGFERDDRWLLAQRIVSSSHFARSRLLSKFLLYVVAETLTERKSELTEHQIGVHVFGRPVNYSSVEDNIVRTYARQVRRRLAEYFALEGSAEPLRIDVPLGGYVPVFLDAVPAKGVVGAGSSSTTAPTVALPPELPDPSAQSQARAPRVKSWKRFALQAFSFAGYSAVLFCFAWIAGSGRSELHLKSQTAEMIRPLWTALFAGPANCYIVPADAGFNLLEDLSGRPLALAEYVKGSYLNLRLPRMDGHSADDLHAQQFTSFVDLQIVTALAQLPEFSPQRAILRFPRDLQIDDLKNANAVILGSMGSNPWAALAESKANFRIVNGDNMQNARIINMRPQAGESAFYVSHWNEPDHETYAVIAFLPNLGGNGHVLLLQGLDVAGTQAAAETLVHPIAIVPILRSAMRPDGSLRPFEVLLRSDSIESRSAGAQIVGSRIY